MPLAPGTRLGKHEILAPLGAGGMGEVYRARDPKLGRVVAIKVLPGDLSQDDEARARLLKEARLAATLNHPNICTIHEVGEDGGHVYLVMELIEGRTLSEKLAERPNGLPTENVLAYGAQIAAALTHAHERNVIHRDLKGSNVVITPDGRVKVLDFGLARRVWEPPEPGGNTLSVALTENGTVVGTPQYLAPEVLRGKQADERSDVWALGVLLHEMAGGALPFKGKTSFELASAILHEVPAALPARIPAGLRGCIRRCLAKEPGERYARASEVRAALEAVDSGDEVGMANPASSRSRRAPIAFIAVALALVAVAIWFARRPPEAPHELKQRQLTSNPAGDPVGAGHISPDGKSLAVLDRTGLSLRSIETGESHALELPPGFSFTPPLPCMSWFPDGSQLLISGRMADERAAVWALPVTGGRMHKVLDDAWCATISPDGRHIAYTRQSDRGGEIWVCALDGGGARRVTGDDSSGVIPAWAVWSPNSKRLIYGRFIQRAGSTGPRLESCDLAGHVRVCYVPPPEQPMHDYTIPAWLPDGRVLFGRTDPPPNQRDLNLWALHVDPSTGAPSGSPKRITQWQRLALVMPTSFSTDGKRLAVGVLEYQSDIYVGRTGAGGAPLRDIRRVTLDDRMDITPSWMADGSTLLFSSDRNGTYDIFRQPVDSASAEPLVTGPKDQLAPHVTADGAWVLYQETEEKILGPTPIRSRIMRIPVSGGAAQQVLVSQAAIGFRTPRSPEAPPVLCEFTDRAVVYSTFDPVDGQKREVAKLGAREPPPWDLSPDGSTLAIAITSQDSIRSIRLVSTTGTAAREIRLERAVLGASMAYGADGHSWLLVEGGDIWRLVHVDERGGVRALIPGQLWMYSVAASPDGRRIAYTSNTGQGNIWLLEDF